MDHPLVGAIDEYFRIGIMGDVRLKLTENVSYDAEPILFALANDMMERLSKLDQITSKEQYLKTLRKLVKNARDATS